MGDERERLGARGAASYACAVRGAGKGGTGQVGVSAERRRQPGVSRDARGRVFAGLCRKDTELLQLAFVGDDRWIFHVGRARADLYSGRVEVNRKPPATTHSRR